MALFSLAELPPALGAHLPPRAELKFPPQGKTSDVAFAEHAGRAVVVKRCAHAIYLDWLRRERFVLEALRDSGLPIPQLIAYAEIETRSGAVGWLLSSRLPGRALLGVLVAAEEAERVTLFGRLGELTRRVHAAAVPPELHAEQPWISAQLEQARKNLPWCDGTAAGLAELERSRPRPEREALIHGDLSLDNVLVDERGALSLIDWAGGARGDPRHDIALALQTKPEFELSPAACRAFFAGYGSPALDESTRAWFVALYDYF